MSTAPACDAVVAELRQTLATAFAAWIGEVALVLPVATYTTTTTTDALA